VLDVVYREDECRLRQGHAGDNRSLLRQSALNLLWRDEGLKVGIKARRLRGASDPDYLAHPLAI